MGGGSGMPQAEFPPATVLAAGSLASLRSTQSGKGARRRWRPANQALVAQPTVDPTQLR